MEVTIQGEARGRYARRDGNSSGIADGLRKGRGARSQGELGRNVTAWGGPLIN